MTVVLDSLCPPSSVYSRSPAEDLRACALTGWFALTSPSPGRSLLLHRAHDDREDTPLLLCTTTLLLPHCRPFSSLLPSPVVLNLAALGEITKQ